MPKFDERDEEGEPIYLNVELPEGRVASRVTEPIPGAALTSIPNTVGMHHMQGALGSGSLLNRRHHVTPTGISHSSLSGEFPVPTINGLTIPGTVAPSGQGLTAYSSDDMKNFHTVQDVLPELGDTTGSDGEWECALDHLVAPQQDVVPTQTPVVKQEHPILKSTGVVKGGELPCQTSDVKLSHEWMQESGVARPPNSSQPLSTVSSLVTQHSREKQECSQGAHPLSVEVVDSGSYHLTSVNPSGPIEYQTNDALGMTRDDNTALTPVSLVGFTYHDDLRLDASALVEAMAPKAERKLSSSTIASPLTPDFTQVSNTLMMFNPRMLTTSQPNDESIRGENSTIVAKPVGDKSRSQLLSSHSVTSECLQTTVTDETPRAGTKVNHGSRLKRSGSACQPAKASKQFRCSYNNCGRSFLKSSSAKSHEMTHTKDRPFKCTQCEKNFGRNHDLQRHINTHMNVKPFFCQNCSVRFTRNDALRRHQRNSPKCDPHGRRIIVNPQSAMDAFPSMLG
ncbi:hypothetical protein IWQ61_003721 [Dispira simplex]|nr:hypothetical protein IWQ61_003721 [Dispira simplex]